LSRSSSTLALLEDSARPAARERLQRLRVGRRVGEHALQQAQRARQVGRHACLRQQQRQLHLRGAANRRGRPARDLGAQLGAERRTLSA
jgi:hypothetical protein